MTTRKIVTREKMWSVMQAIINHLRKINFNPKHTLVYVNLKECKEWVDFINDDTISDTHKDWVIYVISEFLSSYTDNDNMTFIKSSDDRINFVWSLNPHYVYYNMHPVVNYEKKLSQDDDFEDAYFNPFMYDGVYIDLINNKMYAVYDIDGALTHEEIDPDAYFNNKQIVPISIDYSFDWDQVDIDRLYKLIQFFEYRTDI